MSSRRTWVLPALVIDPCTREVPEDYPSSDAQCPTNTSNSANTFGTHTVKRRRDRHVSSERSIDCVQHSLGDVRY